MCANYKSCYMILEFFFFFEEAKLAHLNWHQRESNLRPRRGAHSQVPSQYHQTNPSGFMILEFWFGLAQPYKIGM